MNPLARWFYHLLHRWSVASSRRWLWIAALAAAIVMLLPRPAGLEVEGQRMIGLLVFFAITFVAEAIPVGGSFPLVLGWVIFFGIRPPAEAVMSIAHDAALFMMGALMIARVLVGRNLHRRALALILRAVPAKLPWIMGAMALFSALASTLISDHTVAALMLPVGVSLVVASGGVRRNLRMAKALMMSIAFACALGGLASPSGGSRNVVMMAYLQDIAGTTVGYGSWVLMALPITLLLIPLAVVIPYLVFRPREADLVAATQQLKDDARDEGPMLPEDWGTLAVFAVVLGGWVFLGDRFGIGVIAITGAFVYLVTGLADWEQDYQHINWGIVWLYFAAITFGRALESSGAALWLADSVMRSVQVRLGMDAGLGLAASSSVFMTLFSQAMSDGPAVALMGPVILETARISGTSPILVGVSSAIASSFAYMLIIGTPSNAIIYASGYLESRDFIRAGFWMCLASLVVLILVAALWWPILGVH